MPFKDSFQQNLTERDVCQILEMASQMRSELSGENFLALLSSVRNWHVQGFLQEQQRVCEMVLQALPEQYEALHLMGFASLAKGEFDRAERFFVRALNAKPDHSFARLALAQIHMMQSGFTRGLSDYEARFDVVTDGSGPDWRGLPVARWQGEPIAGKKLYVWAEQGLGDVVMFAGFLPALLAQHPARLVLGMFPKLQSLFARSFPSMAAESIDEAEHLALAPAALASFEQIEKLAQAMPLPFSVAPLKAAHAYAQRHGLFDFAAPMGDLLVHGGVRSLSRKAYLRADPVRAARIAASLATSCGGRRRVGISWATSNRNEWMRNAPLENWLPLLSIENCHFISLQHGEDKSQTRRFRAEHGCAIAHPHDIDPSSDAEDLAALIAGMDEVITIDNANAHLAGALGVPTTLLLPKGHNYRWPEQPGGGTLWYETVHTLRQREAFDWHPVMQEATAELSKRSGA